MIISSSSSRIGRRQAMSSLAAGGLGLSLGGLLQAGELVGRDRPAIRSCIIVFYYGGSSHLDTYDMKPEGPMAIRGEFRPVPSNVPGMPVSEHLPQMARVMDRCAVIRSMHHTNRLHDSASTESLTGRQGPMGDREEFAMMDQFFPCYGAVVNHFNQHRDIDIPHAALPWVFHNVVPTPCQGGGFLGKAFDPFQITGDPKTLTYRNEALKSPETLTSGRLAGRRGLLDQIDSGLSAAAITPAMTELRSFYERAYELIGSPMVSRALDIDSEPRALRERYGMMKEIPRGGGNGAEKGYGRNMRGQNLLLARRLVEAGVPFVNVYDFLQQGQNWDSHRDNFNQNKKYLLPQADQALSALIEDLDDRGLLETTLVVAMGEFGRTPKINASAGRDHWPDCYSVLLAGGGVRGGTYYGASDESGAYPADLPVTPANLAATIYWRFGIDPRRMIHDRTGRPWRLADGAPIRALFDDAAAQAG
ncbi:MAG: DUF1501 domain-containing protein [Planctomycetaceae bacterium]|nr:DUF1501 domain-containing protein [Planctomycetaceae bacterium]